MRNKRKEKCQVVCQLRKFRSQPIHRAYAHGTPIQRRGFHSHLLQFKVLSVMLCCDNDVSFHNLITKLHIKTTSLLLTPNAPSPKPIPVSLADSSHSMLVFPTHLVFPLPPVVQTHPLPRLRRSNHMLCIHAVRMSAYILSR